jgi:hypothetical protein
MFSDEGKNGIFDALPDFGQCGNALNNRSIMSGNKTNRTALVDCNNNRLEENSYGSCHTRKPRRRRRRKKDVVAVDTSRDRREGKARCDPTTTTTMTMTMTTRLLFSTSMWPSVLLAVAVYVNSIDGDFVHDDIPAIVRNPGKGQKLGCFVLMMQCASSTEIVVDCCCIVLVWHFKIFLIIVSKVFSAFFYNTSN